MKSVFFIGAIFYCTFLTACTQKTPSVCLPPTITSSTAKKSTDINKCLPPPPAVKKLPAGSAPLIPVIAKPKVNDVIIVLDPGHGGEDFGTHSLEKPKYQEKFLNFSTSLLVKGFLEQWNYKVILTRTNDTFVSLEERALFANRLNPKLFISIHYNSAPRNEAEGIEIFYYKSNDTRAAKSKQLAQFVLDNILKTTEAKSRGVKSGNYSVIRNTTMTAILIEGGFLTNTKEMNKIKDPKYLKSLALGIAQGIKEYLTKEPFLN